VADRGRVIGGVRIGQGVRQAGALERHFRASGVARLDREQSGTLKYASTARTINCNDCPAT